jgi:S-adenosylmethionine:diacylglycerol 3-amino-3-carboxypropyl transferase
MRLFSQTWVYSLSGNTDKAFTAPDCDSQRIARALQATLDQHTCAESFMFHLIFTGHLRNMSSTTVPPSLQPILLERIQHRLRNNELTIQLVTEDACQYLRQRPPVGNSVFLSLSDLLSFVPASELLDVLTQVKARHTDVEVQGIVRSFLRHDFKPEETERFSQLAALQNVSNQERTRMYQVYHFSL